MRGYRVLGPHEALSLVTMSVLAAVVAAVAFTWPRAFAYPVGALSVVVTLTLLARAWRADVGIEDVVVNHRVTDTKTHRVLGSPKELRASS